MQRWRGLVGAVGLLALVGAGCSAQAAPSAPGGSSATPGATGTRAGSATPAGRSDGRQDARVEVPAGMTSAPFDVDRTVQIPTGWQLSVWARVDGARLATWTPDGRLLVSRPGSGDIVELTPQPGGRPSQRTLVSGLDKPHGMAFARNTLYVAESDQVDRYSYADGSVGARTVVIPDLPSASLPELHGHYAHALKSVVVGRDGSLYVSVGSTGNISAGDRQAKPPRAVILRWTPSTKHLTVFARGVRNGTGLALDPAGALWTAVNNRDQLPYSYHRDWDGDGKDDYGRVLTSFVKDHPLEPVAKLTAGRDLGWPYCDPDPSDPVGSASSPLRFADRPFVNDPDTNADGSQLNCAALPRIEQGLPAHSAPLGMSFTRLPTPFGVGAVIASHGSWDATPPQAPNVTFFPWQDGELGPGTMLVSGFQDPDGTRWGRVVGVAPGPDGAVYITDDQAGAVYRLVPPRR